MATDKGRAAVFFGLYAAMLLYGLFWVRLSQVRDRVESFPLFYALIATALCYVGVRAYLVLAGKATGRWDPFWVAVDLIIISGVVRLTGGIDSEAALVYFWPLTTYAILRRPRGTILVGLASGVLYVAASWPGGLAPEYVDKVSSRVFILTVVTVLATCFARREVQRVEEMTRLREQVALAQYRHRLSQEVHDGIQHYLVSMSLRLELARKLAEKEPARAAAIAVGQRLMLRQAADELHYLVRRLRSPVVEQHGFVEGLREHLTMFEQRSSISAPLEFQGTPVSLPPDVEQAAFRIVQEALTNAEKHSRASEAKVLLRFDPGLLECVVSDNGTGFDPSEVADEPGVEGGFGLPSMRQRAEQAGGEVEIESAPGQGTAVRFTVALARQNQEAAEGRRDDQDQALDS